MKKRFNFDVLVERDLTNSTKWDRYQGRDIIPLWVADTDFAVAPEITEALQQRARHPIFGYSYTPQKLNDLIVERMQRLYQWSIEAQWLVWLPGVVGGMHLSCRSIGVPGDAVYTPSVIYPHFKSTPGLSARDPRSIPMTTDRQRDILDLNWLEQQRAKDVRLLLFCNPHNPGGAVYTRDELSRLADCALAQDFIICADEIHCDLILEPGIKHIPIASLNADIARRSITLMAPSKTFNLAGLGCAFAIIPDRRLRERFKQSAQGIIPYVNLFGYTAACAAYEYADDWNRQQCEYLRANRDFLIREINQIRGLKLGPIQATYLAWIDISGLGLDDPERFFENAGVGLSPGASFGDNHFMRLNFGCPQSRLKQAVERIRLAVSDYWAQ
mgnify:CR=1 FL=1